MSDSISVRSWRFLLLPNCLLKNVATLFTLHREKPKKRDRLRMRLARLSDFVFFFRLNPTHARYFRLRSRHAYFSPLIFIAVLIFL